MTKFATFTMGVGNTGSRCVNALIQNLVSKQRTTNLKIFIDTLKEDQALSINIEDLIISLRDKSEEMFCLTESDSGNIRFRIVYREDNFKKFINERKRKDKCFALGVVRFEDENNEEDVVVRP